MNHTNTRHYYITTKCSMSNDGVVAFLAFSSKADDDDDSFTIRLTFELTTLVADIPKTFRIRSPFARDMPDAGKSGKALVRAIKQSFESGDRRLMLHCPVTRPPSGLPDLSQLHVRARTYIEYTLERTGTAFTTKSLPLSLSQLDIGGGNRSRNPRVWGISFDEVENIMVDKLGHYARFRTIQRALSLYDVIASCGNRVVPRLNRKTKHALSLWLFKQGGASMDEMYGAFVAVVELVRGCVAGNFCPSFCQTQVSATHFESSSTRHSIAFRVFYSTLWWHDATLKMT